ncbi:MAG: ATP-binding cassette domain-containing protein [Saprospiraceae bacterium]|nr:ATP-binding cassette domain-containing protein [Saprospiraceae bacterium]
MNYLTVENLSKNYGDRVLFENITFYINQGDKVAFIAKNGSGKTSLLNIIAGLETPNGGEFFIHPKINIGYLNQNPDLDPNLTVFESVYQSKNPVMQAMAAYEQSMKNPENSASMEKAIADMDRLNAWDYEVKVKQILAKLKVDYFDRKISVLSGGQKKRVAMAKVLIEKPDFLILDEPTNHLDLDMIEWLEDFLSTSKTTIFMVTHDRYFLDRVCNQILELDEQRIFKYQGDYAYYLQKKAEYKEQINATTEKAQNLYKKELDWMRRQPQARTTKAKARIDKFFEIEKKAKRNIAEDHMILDIKMNRLGSKILELHNVSKGYGDTVLIKNFEYKFKQKDRVGFIGKNGAGKSTLLNILTKKETPDSGKVVHGDTLVLGYYTQAGMKLKEDRRAVDVIRDIAEYIPMNGGRKLSAVQLLDRFMFDHKKQLTYVSKLSGGEKRRLYLLTILMKNPNFLILDEPTNDLDLLTLQVLEEFLKSYPGVVLIVSHDRHFMDKIVEQVFVLPGDGTGKIRNFPGNYSYYKDKIKAEASLAQAEQKQNKTATANTKTKEKDNSNNKEIHEARKELRKVERQVTRLEEKKKKITAQFDNPKLSQEDIVELSKELSQVEEELEEKEMEWMELAEKIEG